MNARPLPLTARLGLRAADRCRPLLRWVGVVHGPFRELLRLRAVVASRRGETLPPFLAAVVRALPILAAIFGIHCGLILGIVAFYVPPFVFGTVVGLVVFAIAGLPLFFSLAFGSHLLDTTDVDVVAPLPVPDRTVLAARTAHAVLAVLGLEACFLLPLAPLGAAAFGPAFLAFVLLAAVLAPASVLASIALAYVSTLRLVPLRHVRNAILALQCVAGAGLFGGAQLLPALLNRLALDEWLARHPAAICLVPPAWYGGLLRLLVGDPGPYDVPLATLAWGVPSIAVALLGLATRTGVVRRILAAAHEGGAERARPRRRGIAGRAGSFLGRDGLDRAGYGFFLGVAAGDRQFLMRLWPVLLGLAALLASFFLTFTPALEHGIAGVVLLLPFVVFQVLEVSPYTKDPGAAGVFAILTEAQRLRVARGARKALVARFHGVPLVLAVGIWLAAARSADPFELLLAVALSIAILRFVLGRFEPEIPFTRPAPLGEEAAAFRHLGAAIVTFATTVAALVLVLALGAVPYGRPVATAIAGGWLAYRGLRACQNAACSRSASRTT